MAVGSHVIDGDALRLGRVDLVPDGHKLQRRLIGDDVDLGFVDQDGQLAVGRDHRLDRVEEQVEQALRHLAEMLVQLQVVGLHLCARRVPAQHVVLGEGLLVLLEPRAQVVQVGARRAGRVDDHLHLKRVGDLDAPPLLLAKQRAEDPRARLSAALRARAREVVAHVDDDERVQRHVERGGRRLGRGRRLGLRHAERLRPTHVCAVLCSSPTNIFRVTKSRSGS